MRLSVRTRADFSVLIELTRGEAKALDALVGYGFDEFLKVFYNHLGKHYLSPYENDLKSLFENINKNIIPELSVIEKAEKAFHESTKKVVN